MWSSYNIKCFNNTVIDSKHFISNKLLPVYNILHMSTPEVTKIIV